MTFPEIFIYKSFMIILEIYKVVVIAILNGIMVMILLLSYNISVATARHQRGASTDQGLGL